MASVPAHWHNRVACIKRDIYVQQELAEGNVVLTETGSRTNALATTEPQQTSLDSIIQTLNDFFRNVSQRSYSYSSHCSEPQAQYATHPVQLMNRLTFSIIPTTLAWPPFWQGLQEKRRQRHSIPHRWHRCHSVGRLSNTRQPILQQAQMPVAFANQIQRHPLLAGMKRAQKSLVRTKYSRLHVLTNCPPRSDLIFGRKGSITGI